MPNEGTIAFPADEPAVADVLALAALAVFIAAILELAAAALASAVNAIANCTLPKALVQ
jgi:hypothetical protein